MKSSPSLVMKDLDFSKTAQAVAEVATANAVPALVYPRGEPSNSVVQMPDLPAVADVGPVADEPTIVLKVPVAHQLHRWIKDQADEERSSKLYIILKALKKAGAPIDLKSIAKDGRRVR